MTYHNFNEENLVMMMSRKYLVGLEDKLVEKDLGLYFMVVTYLLGRKGFLFGSLCEIGSFEFV